MSRQDKKPASQMIGRGTLHRSFTEFLIESRPTPINSAENVREDIAIDCIKRRKS